MRILIADDDLISRKMLEGILTSAGNDVVLANDGAEALKIIKESPPQLAILDWMMPNIEGPQICEAVRKLEMDKYIYMILVTSRAKKTDILEAIKLGADDYLIKPYDPLELQARLLAGSRIIELQEQLIAAREAMRLQATHDSMTGLWNHRGIIEIMEREWLRIQRENQSFSVIMADVDFFKKVNDTYGHPGGDAVLKEVASRMSTALRPYDLVGRYGGEEFMIVLPGCSERDLAKLGERVRECIQSKPCIFQDKVIPITISVGGAAMAAPISGGVHGLIQMADEALYRAKKGGRNRVEVAVANPPAR